MVYDFKSSVKIGNQGCVGQKGTTNKPVAFSFIKFFKALAIRQNGGKA